MIETREQYFKGMGELIYFGNTEVFSMKALSDTIEALRRFVRAHDKVDAARIGALTMDLKEFNLLVTEFRSARAALPKWLTDD